MLCSCSEHAVRAVLLQARQVATVFAALTLSVIFLLLVKLDSCWTFIFMWWVSAG